MDGLDGRSRRRLGDPERGNVNLQGGDNMNIRTKTVIVHGQEMVMSSVDGQTWFLRLESLYEFEARLRESQGILGEEPQQIMSS